MSAFIYIHGFLSSPQSFKAQQVAAWMAVHYPAINYYCPQLTPYPAQTQAQLESLVESLLPGPVYLMGSSLGGFWATWLAEKYNLCAVLINPATQPAESMPRYVGIELNNFHTQDTYRLHAHHVDEIRRVTIPVSRTDNYWLLVQTGDEVLDYQLAVKKYAGCKQTVEQGGDHGFQGFDKYFEECMQFFMGAW